MLTRKPTRRPLTRPIHDGARELAAAIGSLSALVEVRFTTRGFVTKPAELFDLRFPQAGIALEQMPFLRAHLSRQLPEIEEDLSDNAETLDNPNHRIGDYAEFLRVALAMRARPRGRS